MSSSEEESEFDEDFFDDDEAVYQAIFRSEDSDKEEEFEGFPLQLPANMTWTSIQFDQEIDPFSLQCGPTPNAAQQRCPLEYFQLFFDNEIIRQITELTNRNAAFSNCISSHNSMWNMVFIALIEFLFLLRTLPFDNT